MKEKWLAIGVVCALALAISTGTVNAAVFGTVRFTGVVLNAGNSCAEAQLEILEGWAATEQDLGASDFTIYLVEDGAGVAIETGVYGHPSASFFSFTNSVNLNSINPITMRPLTITLYDVHGDPSIIGLMPPDQRVAAAKSLTALASSSFDPATVLPSCASLPIRVPGSPFTDGRRNPEAWQSAAVYCQPGGRVDVYGINASGRGSLSLRVTKEQIDAVGIPSVNTIIASAHGPLGEITLWRLTSGEFVVFAPGLPPDTGKTYHYVWGGC